MVHISGSSYLLTNLSHATVQKILRQHGLSKPSKVKGEAGDLDPVEFPEYDDAGYQLDRILRMGGINLDKRRRIIAFYLDDREEFVSSNPQLDLSRMRRLLRSEGVREPKASFLVERWLRHVYAMKCVEL